MLVRGELARTVLTADLGRLIRLEGCLSGNVPDDKGGPRQPAARVPRDRRADAAKVVFGPGTFINTAVNQTGRVPAPPPGNPASGPGSGRRGAQALRAAATRHASRSAWPTRLSRRSSRSSCSSWSSSAALRADRHPAHRRSRLRVPARIRLGAGGRAEVALRLPVPVEELGDDHDPLSPASATRSAGGRSRSSARPPARRCFARARARYIVTGVPVVTEGLADAAELDPRAAGGGAGADGRHAGAGVPLSPAPAAARAGARRGGDDVRRPVAAGREPDDGLDRRAAGADRPGGGLRDPVPGPLRRGRGARRPRIRPRPQRRPAVRPSSPRGWTPPWASSCSCSRPCPWCAASAPCSCSASARGAVRALRRLRGAGSLPRPAPPGRRGHADARGAGRAGAPPARGACASGWPTAPGARWAWRSRGRAGCWPWAWRWPWWGWRSTPRARWCPTSASLCPRTRRRSRTWRCSRRRPACRARST